MISSSAERTCSICGKPVVRTNMLYCSVKCRQAGFTIRQRERRRKDKEQRQKLPDRACKICGTLFEVTSPNKIYCSMECQALRPRTKYKRTNKDESFRRCLKCGRRFHSTGINNRLCISCNKENELICIGSEIGIWLDGEHR
jgi:endogenous inhibitor of DNA gyrase (YacG/DUF329 family)